MQSAFIPSRLHIAPAVSIRALRPVSPPLLNSLPPPHSPSAPRHICQSNRGSSLGVADRTLAALPYLIPLSDGLRYSRFFLMQFPSFASLLSPLVPFISLQQSIPFGSTILFFAVYFGVAMNQSFSRFVRFNAAQACLLDIALIIPSLLESLVGPPRGGNLLQVYITGYNTVWLFCFICVAYAVGSCVMGVWARLPFLAENAEQQIGSRW